MRKGFTLLETLVVISIIVILAGLVTPLIAQMYTKSQYTHTQHEMRSIDAALTAYYQNNGAFPQGGTSAMLGALNLNYFEFDSKRIKGNTYQDPLGGMYVYSSPGIEDPRGYDLYSMGALMAVKNGAIGGSGTIGDPTGLGDQIIFGNSIPTYDTIVRAILGVLRNTFAGEELARILNIAKIPILWDDVSTGVLAYYRDSNNTIYLSGVYFSDLMSAGYPAVYSMAAVLAHEATHVKQHVEDGNDFYDSIEKEYQAFVNGAKVWKELREQIKDNYSLDPMQEFFLNLVESGEEKTKEWIRQSYTQWPES